MPQGAFKVLVDKMVGDEVNINWNQLEVSAANSFKNLWNNNNFTDVTLATEDDKQIKAHKVILSSFSNLFTKILFRNPHPNFFSCWPYWDAANGAT